MACIISVTHPPRIITCRQGYEDANKEVFNSTFVGGTTGCDDTRDTFVNLPPHKLFYAFDFDMRLPTDITDQQKHKYIAGYSFGIVEAKSRLTLRKRDGRTFNLIYLLAISFYLICVN